MTDASINREKFDFNLPFDIALDSRYDSKNLIIDIDNFYYEIINNEFLSVNIDVYIEGDKINTHEETKEDSREDEPPIITLIPPTKNEKELLKPIQLPNENDRNNSENFFEMNINYQKPQVVDLDDNEDKCTQDEFNIFDNIDNSDTYVTYHVYIVKETDTIDTIMEKYNVKKENLSLYNDIENIKTGSKLIIPYESRD